MGAASQHLGGRLAEPSLDQVQPAPAGRREVEAVARVSGQPSFDLRGFVDGVVIER